MELHSHHKPRRAFTGRGWVLRSDPTMQHAIGLADARAEAALRAGRLLSPGEALALAGPEARRDETLFSIACAVARETGCDQGEILCWLGTKFPDLS